MIREKNTIWKLHLKVTDDILILGISYKRKGAIHLREKITFLLAAVGTVSFFIGVLFLSFELVVFSDPDYGMLEKEYRKYNVQEDLDMEMPDIMYVTTEMMEYLKGNREELTAVTTIEGSEQEFFNEQDRFHMEEVQKLMLGTHNTQYVFLAIGILLMAAAGLMGYRQRKNSSNGMLAGVGIFLTVTIVSIVFGALNFNRLFEWFHLLLFDNDKWLFDPAEDYMIRMLPEGLFMDIAFRIGLIFFGAAAVFLIVTILWKIHVRKHEDQEIYEKHL